MKKAILRFLKAELPIYIVLPLFVLNTAALMFGVYLSG